jgi:hypothetical protein
MQNVEVRLLGRPVLWPFPPTDAYVGVCSRKAEPPRLGPAGFGYQRR